MDIHTVVKVGGSLLRFGRPVLAALMETLADAAASVPLLVIPGGGIFDGAVRDVAKTYRLGDDAAHWMAILAMDAYGWLLADLTPRAMLVDDLSEAAQTVQDGHLAVLLPSRLLRQRDELPHTWNVTSDSIAVWVAGACGASRVVLLKDVDGVFPADPRVAPAAMPLSAVDPATASLLGVVDSYFPRAVLPFLPAVECWILNGTDPARVAALLLQGTAPGTRVVPEGSSA